jgi:hypothetical protein
MEELEMIKRKIIGLLLAVVMVAAMVPAMAVSATGPDIIINMRAEIITNNSTETLLYALRVRGDTRDAQLTSLANFTRWVALPAGANLNLARIIPRAPRTGEGTPASIWFVKASDAGFGTNTSLVNTAKAFDVWISPRGTLERNELLYTTNGGGGLWLRTENIDARPTATETSLATPSDLGTENFVARMGRDGNFFAIGGASVFPSVGFPTGVSVEVARVNGALDNETTFASVTSMSAPARIRIPAIPRAPGIRPASGTSVISGLRPLDRNRAEAESTLQFPWGNAGLDIIGQAGLTWAPIMVGSEKRATLTSLGSSTAGQVLYIRTAPTARAPASFPFIFTPPAATP